MLVLSRPNSLQSVPNIQSPGTEFLDAETGGQESTGWSVTFPKFSRRERNFLDAETRGRIHPRDLNPFSENSFVTD